MKNLVYHLLLLILTTILITSCNKNDNITNNPSIINAGNIDKLNAFLPSDDAHDRYNLIISFREQYKTYQSDLKSDIVFEDKSAALARYEMETSLLNDEEICFLRDSTVVYCCDKKSNFTLSIVDFDGEGNPIISGTDMMQKYQDLENEMNNLNLADSLVISIQIQIVGFDENTTGFSVDYAIGTWGEFMGCWTMVINPWEYPIPFENGISLSPCENVYPNACSEITRKLNPHNPVLWCDCAGGFPFVEFVYPWWSTGWNSGAGYHIMWAGTGCYSLETEELNYYLNLYKNILDQIRPTGLNNIYAYKVRIYEFDYIENNAPCEFWAGGGFDVCHYHYLVGWNVEITCIPISTE